MIDRSSPVAPRAPGAIAAPVLASGGAYPAPAAASTAASAAPAVVARRRAMPLPARPGAGRWRLLILGGTSDAAALAAEVAALPRLDVITSLAGRTRVPADLAGAVRVGGFGGSDALAAWLRSERIDMLVDATHPYAATISANAARACEIAAVPRLMLERPAWTRRPGDRWVPADSTAHAASRLPAGARVLLTIGRQEVPAFATRPDCRFVVRLIDPPDAAPPLPGAELVFGRGPFTLDDERALLRTRSIDCLVTKNSGGTPTYPKIQAAREAGLPVVMIERPPLPNGARVGDVLSVLGWIGRGMAGQGCWPQDIAML